MSEHIISLDTASQRYLASVSIEDVMVSCPEASVHQFSFTVSDEDGNVSDPKIVDGVTD